MTGYYQMQRGWQDHDLFAGDEYSRRDAWEWLVANAAWKDTKTRIGGKSVMLKRGQLSHSIRFMAEKWGWSRSKTHRFLCDLKIETMIETGLGQWQDIITICNYDKFQAETKNSETIPETTSETRLGQGWDKEEEGKKERIISEAKASSIKSAAKPAKVILVLPDWLDVEAWEAFLEMRKTIRSAMTPYAQRLAITKLDGFRAKGHDPTKILEKSTLNNWKDLFEPKDETHGNRSQNTGSAVGDAPTTRAINPHSEPPKSKWRTEAERLAAKYRSEAALEAGQGTAGTGAG